MEQLVGFLLHPPLSEIGKKIGKVLKYTPTFKVLSAPLYLSISIMDICLNSCSEKRKFQSPLSQLVIMLFS